MLEIHEWDQSPTETADEFRAFNTFKALPPDTRSVALAFKKFAPEEAAQSDKPSARFAHWASLHHWRDRASAFDLYLQQIATDDRVSEVKKDRLKERVRRRKMLDMLHDYINSYAVSIQADALAKKLEPNQIRGLANIVGLYAQQSRLEYNDDGKDENTNANSSGDSNAEGIRAKLQRKLFEGAESDAEGDGATVLQ